MSTIHFFYMTVNMTEVFLLAVVVNLRFTDNKPDKDHRKRNHGNTDQGHQPVDAQHHDQNTNYAGQRCDDLGETLIKSLIDCINIVCDSREDLSMGDLIKKANWKPVKFLGNLFAQLVRDFRGDGSQNIALDHAE